MADIARHRDTETQRQTDTTLNTLTHNHTTTHKHTHSRMHSPIVVKHIAAASAGISSTGIKSFTIVLQYHAIGRPGSESKFSGHRLYWTIKPKLSNLIFSILNKFQISEILSAWPQKLPRRWLMHIFCASSSSFIIHHEGSDRFGALRAGSACSCSS